MLRSKKNLVSKCLQNIHRRYFFKFSLRELSFLSNSVTYLVLSCRLPKWFLFSFSEVTLSKKRAYIPCKLMFNFQAKWSERGHLRRHIVLRQILNWVVWTAPFRCKKSVDFKRGKQVFSWVVSFEKASQRKNGRKTIAVCSQFFSFLIFLDLKATCLVEMCSEAMAQSVVD